MAAVRTVLTMSRSLQRADNGEQPPWMLVSPAALPGRIGLSGGGFVFGYGAPNALGSDDAPLPGPTLPPGDNAVPDFIPVARIAELPLQSGAAFSYDGATYRSADVRLVDWAGGNRFHRHQDLNWLQRAWTRSGTIIVNERYWTPTAKRADFVFPATPAAEREDIGDSMREGHLLAMAQLPQPPAEARDDHAISAAPSRRLQCAGRHPKTLRDRVRHTAYRGSRRRRPARLNYKGRETMRNPKLYAIGPARAAAAAIAVAAATVFGAGQALAEWPEGNLRVIVPYAPGGTSDNITRAVTPALERILETSITVENIGGGGGVIGVTRLADAKPDGRTFGFVPTATLVIAPLMRNVKYDPIQDIAPVAKVAESYGALAVRNDFPADTLDEVIAWAGAHPGEMTFGSAGIGSITHLYVEVFASAAGVQVNHVPFKGSSEALNNVLGGHVDGQFDAVVLRQAQAGGVKPIAILNDDRWDGLPDVPTMKELGFDAYDSTSSWFGFIAPAGISEEARTGFSDAVAEALKDPEVLARLEALGVLPRYLSASDFGQLIERNLTDYEALLTPLGLAK